MVFLRMIDDDQLSARQSRRDRYGHEAMAGQIFLDGQSGDHRNAEGGHHRALYPIGMIERHRARRGKAVAMPPCRHLSSSVGSFLS